MVAVFAAEDVVAILSMMDIGPFLKLFYDNCLAVMVVRVVAEVVEAAVAALAAALAVVTALTVAFLTGSQSLIARDFKKLRRTLSAVRSPYP